LGLYVSKKYGLDEQLEAIEKLGDSKNPIAFAYIEKLKVIETGGKPVSSKKVLNYINHIYAQGELGKVLFQINNIDTSTDVTFREAIVHPEFERAYSIISKASAQLGKDLWGNGERK